MSKENFKKPTDSKEEKPGIAQRVGDAIENLGDKIEQSGFKKVGEAIGNLGDKIEHSMDKKPKVESTGNKSGNL